MLGLAFAVPRLGAGTGLGATAVLSPPQVRELLEVSLSATTSHYHRTRVQASRGPLLAVYGYDWRPRERFFGLGGASSRDSISSYAAQSQHVRLEVAYQWRITSRSSRGLRLGAWIGPREQVIRTDRDPGLPSFDLLFPALAAGMEDRHVENLVYGARFSYDARAGSPHWDRGWRVSYQAERFDKPIRALAFRDASSPVPQFSRQTLELETGLGFMRDPRTLRASIRVVDTRYRGDAGPLPISDLATLGANAGLAGFGVGRFHDLDAAVGRLTYILPLVRRLEFDVHAEAGQVYGDVWQDMRLEMLRGSYGAALRVRTKSSVLGWFGLDWSGESRRFTFNVWGEP